MKKILFTLAVAAMVLGAASCQKENLGKIETAKTVDNPLNTITVICGADTRLAVDGENLTPAFEENDVIFGWDKDGNTYAYTCAEVEGGVATFTRTSTGAPSADEGTTVNLVYAPGYGIEDIVDKTLDVNLAVQGETLPVVMHAMGEVDAQGECEVIFNNDVAIVDIKDAVLPGAAENEEYTIAFLGKNTSLKFALNEFGDLNYEAAVEGSISSSVKAKASADSKISKRFAVPASLEATDVTISATAADGSSYEFSAGSKEIVAGKYITVADKEFTPQYVAKVGEVGYMDIAKAFEAANAAAEDVTVEMLEDAESSAALNVNNANGNKITLDLNGCTVSSQIIVTTDFEVADATGEGVVEAEEYTIKIGEENNGVNASFILNGGTVKALEKNYAIAADGTKNGAQPTVLIKKGTLVAANGSATRTRYASMTFGDETDGEISVNSKLGLWVSYTTDVVINKGSFISTARIAYFGNSSSGATFNGGTFTTEGSGFAYNSETVNPSFEILGGFFTWNETQNFVQEANNKASVSGGYFSSKIPDMCVATGYICKESSTYVGYPYEVAVNEDKSIVKVGTDKFETIAEAVTAINAATSEVEVQFLQNVDLDQEIVINNANAKIVIDINGKTIKAQNAATSAIVVEGAATVIDFVDNVGGGIIDHTYTNTAYTLTVNSGTVNLISANISNMTSTGFGRNAVRVLADGADAHFNMTGGVVRGGRGIRVGGSETAKAYVTISGGLVEGRNTDSDNYYTAISLESGYSEVLINGGTIKGNGAKSVVYCNKDCATTSTIVITKNEVTGSIPYLYSNGCKYVVAAGGSSEYGKLVYSGSWNYYTNNTANSWTGSTLTKTALDPKITDEYGYEYTHRCHKDVN